WLASLMHAESGFDADFAVFTAAALDVALAGLGVNATPEARQTLLDSYLRLDAFPDAAPALRGLVGRPRWILSNGSQAMLDPLVAQSPLAAHLEGVLTVERARRFKPHPAVYRLAVEQLGMPAVRIGFVP